MGRPLAAGVSGPPSDQPGQTGRVGYGRRGRCAGILLPLAIVVTLAFGIALPAGARPSASTLRLRLLDATDSVPNWGDEITFDLNTSAAQPFVNLRCYQGQAFVYDSWAGFYDGAWFGRTFTLTSSTWQAGDADCTARLVEFARNGRERLLAQIGFRVYA
jgi:hypothetical protein